MATPPQALRFGPDPRTTPFTQMLMQPQQGRGPGRFDPRTGYGGATAGVMQVAGDFLEGARKQRVQNYLKQEQDRQEAERSFVDWVNRTTLDPNSDLTPEALRAFQSQVTQTIGTHLGSETKDLDKKGIGAKARDFFVMLSGGEMKVRQPINLLEEQSKLQNLLGTDELRKSHWRQRANEELIKAENALAQQYGGRALVPAQATQRAAMQIYRRLNLPRYLGDQEAQRWVSLPGYGQYGAGTRELIMTQLAQPQPQPAAPAGPPTPAAISPGLRGDPFELPGPYRERGRFEQEPAPGGGPPAGAAPAAPPVMREEEGAISYVPGKDRRRLSLLAQAQLASKTIYPVRPVEGGPSISAVYVGSSSDASDVGWWDASAGQMLAGNWRLTSRGEELARRNPLIRNIYIPKPGGKPGEQLLVVEKWDGENWIPTTSKVGEQEHLAVAPETLYETAGGGLLPRGTARGGAKSGPQQRYEEARFNLETNQIQDTRDRRRASVTSAMTAARLSAWTRNVGEVHRMFASLGVAAPLDALKAAEGSTEKLLKLIDTEEEKLLDQAEVTYGDAIDEANFRLKGIVTNFGQGYRLGTIPGSRKAKRRAGGTAEGKGKVGFKGYLNLPKK